MHHRHRRFVSLPLLALAGVPACFAPHDPVIVTDGSEEGGSADTSEGSASEGPTTSATSATGPTTGATSPSTSDPDGSSEGSGDTGASVCGDAMVDADEVCDDGINDGSYGGCSADCMSLGPHCGDSVAQAEEACDDGDDINGNGCNIDCIESGTVLWTRTLDAGALYRVAVDDTDGVLVIGAGELPTSSSPSASLIYFDALGDQGWTDDYVYPSATSTSAWGVSFHPEHDWMVGGRAYNATDSYSAWWRPYSAAGAPGGVSVYKDEAHEYDTAADLAFDGSGNLYVVGASDVGTSVNIWLRKHDSDGEELWTQTFDSGDNDYPESIAVGSDGYVVVGARLQAGLDKTSWLRKYGPEGNTVWTTTLGAAGWYNEFGDVAIGPDLEVVAAATQDAAGVVVKYTEDGDLDWTVTIDSGYDCSGEGCSATDAARGVAVDSAGAVVAVGHKQNSAFGDDIWIAKYDGEGVELWSDAVAAPDPDSAWRHSAWDVAITSSDGLVVVGGWDETGIGGEVLRWIQKYAP